MCSVTEMSGIMVTPYSTGKNHSPICLWGHYSPEVLAWHVSLSTIWGYWFIIQYVMTGGGRSFQFHLFYLYFHPWMRPIAHLAQKRQSGLLSFWMSKTRFSLLIQVCIWLPPILFSLLSLYYFV